MGDVVGVLVGVLAGVLGGMAWHRMEELDSRFLLVRFLCSHCDPGRGFGEKGDDIGSQRLPGG